MGREEQIGLPMRILFSEAINNNTFLSWHTILA
jgi:hypothetical protein